MASKNGFKGPEGSQHPGFPKGQSGNPKGGNKIRITKSPLRKTAQSLREVEEHCLEVIKDAVMGKEVDKTSLETSRWVLQTIMALDKASSQEEIQSARVRLEAKKAEDQGAGVDEVHKADVLDGKSRFSLVCQTEDED